MLFSIFISDVTYTKMKFFNLVIECLVKLFLVFKLLFVYSKSLWQGPTAQGIFRNDSRRDSDASDELFFIQL